MAIQTALWKVSGRPERLLESSLVSERLLEDMIVARPELLSESWMLIGRQERTSQGGIIDLLAIAPDGSLVLIELKRDRTPREVVAQTLDYACWVEQLKSEDIAGIYARFKPGGSLANDFRSRFGHALDEDALNQSHQIVIVASSIDESSERIVGYLNRRDIAINVLCFQVFSHGAEQLLSRAWLLDPVQTQLNSVASGDSGSEPWNGECYVSFGDDASRSWDEARKYGFICAGGGTWYTRTLQLLNPGDRVWVNVPGRGYVGVGEVTGKAVPASAFTLKTPDGEVAALSLLTQGEYHRSKTDDVDLREVFVPVSWQKAVPIEGAIQEVGLFGNQNTVCKPTTPKWRSTVERLKEKFGIGV